MFKDVPGGSVRCSQSNRPALSPKRLGEFLRKLYAVTTINDKTRIAMPLVVLTACRKPEVVGAKWSEIDRETAERDVPAERMKAGRADWVPLLKQAGGLLGVALHRSGARLPQPS